MIYTVFEIAASLADSIILIAFLTYALRYKKNSLKFNIPISVFFTVIFLADLLFLNHFVKAEGILALSYYIILYLYSLISLKGHYIHKLLLTLLENVILFMINTLISVASMKVIGTDFSNLVLMRNPARVFLLLLSKLITVMILIPIAITIRNGKQSLRFKQVLLSIFLLISSVISGCIVEKMIFENTITSTESTIILCNIAVISLLLILLIFQFSAENKISIEKAELQTRLNDEIVKMKEMIRWSDSIRSIQHDLNNHMTILERYIRNGKNESALKYIQEITERNRINPTFIDTDSSALNAILDAKKIICSQNYIDLKCYIQSDSLTVDEFVFCTILGNLMDNAIEAEKSEAIKEIRIAVETDGSLLHLIVQNRIQSPVLKNGNMPETSKSDKSNHGLGIKNVINMVKNNGGSIDMFEEHNWLVVDVLIPCNK